MKTRRSSTLSYEKVNMFNETVKEARRTEQICKLNTDLILKIGSCSFKYSTYSYKIGGSTFQLSQY